MELIFLYGAIVFHAHHQGNQSFIIQDVQMMQGSPPLLSLYKMDFFIV
jgi:hypothetical protein